MQNKYFKSAIISSAIAVTTGVVLFGINATFGAPTYQPPGADVSPTFTGLNVTGPIANSGGEVTINDTDGLSVSNGNLSVSGTGYFDKLAITKEITAGGAIWAQDGIDATQGSGTISAKTITASTSVAATSVSTGGLEVTGDIKNSYNQPVTINDPEGLKISAGALDVAGSIKNTAGVLPLKIDDSVDVTGTLNVNTVKSIGGVALNLQGGSIKMGGLLDASIIVNNTPGVNPVYIGDGLDVSGSISSMTGAVSVEDADGLSLINTLLNLYGNSGIQNTFGTSPVKITDAQGLMVTQTGGGAGTTKALTLTAGNDAGYYGNNQILFGYNGNDYYMHSIKSRHNANGKAGNALDFYVWDQGVDAAGVSGVVGTKQVMTLDGNGNVGIGTKVPGSKLHVSGSDTLGGRMGLLIDNIATTGTHLATVTLKTAGINYGDIFGGAADLGFGLVNGITISPGVNTQDIGFRTGNQLGGGATGPSMIIKASGKVGIGTNAPATALSVTGKVTSTLGFGTYNRYLGVGKDVPALVTLWGVPIPGTGTMTVSCPAGEILVSCGFFTTKMTPNRTASDTNTCYVDATNATAAPQWLNAQAVCLNPNL